VTSTHGKMGESSGCWKGQHVLGRLRKAAEQFSRVERWRWLLSVIFRNYLGGRLLKLRRYWKV